MTTSHTPGELYVVESEEHWGRVNCHITAKHDDAMLGSIWCGTTSQNRADARRLVAAWNACEGIPTAWIEGGAADILEHAQSLKSQRDELLSLLSEVSENFTREDDLPKGLLSRIDAAIKKAEGKS